MAWSTLLLPYLLRAFSPSKGAENFVQSASSSAHKVQNRGRASQQNLKLVTVTRGGEKREGRAREEAAPLTTDKCVKVPNSFTGWDFLLLRCAGISGSCCFQSILATILAFRGPHTDLS